MKILLTQFSRDLAPMSKKQSRKEASNSEEERRRTVQYALLVHSPYHQGSYSLLNPADAPSLFSILRLCNDPGGFPT